jgi:hypothetical protein
MASAPFVRGYGNMAACRPMHRRSMYCLRTRCCVCVSTDIKLYSAWNSCLSSCCSRLLLQATKHDQRSEHVFRYALKCCTLNPKTYVAVGTLGAWHRRVRGETVCLRWHGCSVVNNCDDTRGVACSSPTVSNHCVPQHNNADTARVPTACGTCWR